MGKPLSSISWLLVGLPLPVWRATLSLMNAYLLLFLFAVAPAAAYAPPASGKAVGQKAKKRKGG
jgi:hypothetical protein